MPEFFVDNPSALMLWIKSSIYFCVIFGIGLLIRKYVDKIIQKFFQYIGISTSPEASKVAAKYILFWFFLIALYTFFLTAPIQYNHALFSKFFYIAFALSFVLLTASIIAKGFQKYIPESIGINVLKIIIFFIGLVLVLHQVGIKLTPILTALGIGTLAVALALQDTLGNFFAGMNILLSKQIARGDYIRLDSGQEGTVIEIDWRLTRIREISNTVITIPNVKITSSIITNYHYQYSDVTSSIECSIAYDSDLDKVERVAIEAAKEVLNNSEMAIKTFTPIVRFYEFGEYAINFKLIFRLQNVFAKGEINHNIIKNIKKRFEEENIRIPFPQRVVHKE